MQHISYILQDEYEHLLQQKQNLEKQYKEESLRKRNACEQWAETWHDNADYEEAEYQQKILSSRINTISNIIRNTKILVKENLSKEIVQIWSEVTVLIDNTRHTYIIGWNPTLPSRVSYQSPLGSTLFNKKIGSKISFSHNNKVKKITILAIT